MPGKFASGQKEVPQKLTDSLTRDQLTWLDGYLAALGKEFPFHADEHPAEWKLFYASMSGNAEWVAEEAGRIFEEHHIPLKVIDLWHYDPYQIIQETKALFVISTHGEGDPPYAAEAFHAYIHNNNPDLHHLQFSLLALGDSSYLQFCQAGRDIDKRLNDLGAERIYPRADCDQEYEGPARNWLEGIIRHITA